MKILYLAIFAGLGALGLGAQTQGFSVAEVALLRAAIAGWSVQEEAPSRSLLMPSMTKIDPALWPETPDAERSLGAAAPVEVEVRGTTLQSTAALAGAVAALGGAVTHAFENVIYASVPARSVAELAGRSDVAYVQASRPRLMQQARPLTSDGIQAARVNAAHQVGLRGRGVRVGILDAGFGGYSRLLASGRVRSPIAMRAFPPGHPNAASEVHGTACAEIISAIAPEAQLVLASYDGRDGNAMAAAMWLIEQGVRVISFSMGGVAGPSNGLDEFSRFVDRTTRQYNVQWVVSAGNEAERHWSTMARDQDENRLVDINYQGLPGLFLSPATDTMRLTVKWDDWGGNPRLPHSTQDLDTTLYLVDGKGKNLVPVATRNRRQGPGVPPEEHVDLSAQGLAGKRFFLALRATRLERPVRVHVFLETPGILLPNTPGGSLTNPATAHLALSVGAIDVLSKALAPYSSQGPTDDNRLKPEISAPTNTNSAAYGDRFPGTSAACPHVAGIAALLLQAYPAIQAAELKRRLILAVRPLGDQVPNAQTGFGAIDASRVRVDRADAAGAPPAGAESMLSIPAAFGSTVATSLLAKLRERSGAPRDGLQVRVTAGRELYELGDGMRLGMLASEPAKCLLFQHDTVRGFSLAVPLAMQPLALTPSEPLLIPADADATLEVVEPAGPGELFLVCAQRPRPLARALEDPADWATSVFSYFVLPPKTR
ncbi:MAG: S8 family serine peptidase [Acidobacteriota bacterium]|jgi:subtilisin family serine protease